MDHSESLSSTQTGVSRKNASRSAKSIAPLTRLGSSASKYSQHPLFASFQKHYASVAVSASNNALMKLLRSSIYLRFYPIRSPIDMERTHSCFTDFPYPDSVKFSDSLAQTESENQQSLRYQLALCCLTLEVVNALTHGKTSLNPSLEVTRGDTLLSWQKIT